MKTFIKKTIIIFAAILSTLISQAQTVEWVNQYDSDFTYGVKVATDASGNIYTLGAFRNTGTFGAFTMTSSINNGKVFITKTDPSGNTIWATKCEGFDNQLSGGIYVDASAIYISGLFSNTAAFGTTTLTSGSNLVASFIAKMDLSGNFLWAKKFNVSSILSVCTSTTGNIYAAGTFTSLATFGTFTASCSGNEDAFVAKLDVNGNATWFNKMGSNFPDRATSVVSDASGNAYVGGYFSGTVAFGSFSLTSYGSRDLFIAKVNGTGTVQWAKQFGGANDDFGTEVTINSAGNIYFSGGFSPPSTFGTFTVNSGNLAVGQLDAAGTVIWVSQYGEINNASLCDVFSIAADPTGNIYTSGRFSGTSSFGTTTLTAVGLDAFLTKVNSTGNFVWVKQMISPGNPVVISSVSHHSGKVYCGGYFDGTASIDNFTMTTAGFSSGFIMKVSSTPIGIKENYQDISVNVYPNPVSDKLIIESYVFNQTLKVTVTDLLGKDVLNKNFIYSKTETLDVSMLLPGVYFLRVSSAEKSGVVKIVKE
ncbi:MAG: T9SS type A sorting domain-containing protein [Bacteroidia bacterium]|nr:T9SS type A sorting domain-containing protein [Bacteroidia bacterium]